MKIKAPKHLTPDARKHWNRIQAEFELTADTALILQVGLENWDQGQEARRLIREQGLILGNGRRHPACEVQKNADALFMRSLRELGLNRGEPGEVGRPTSGF